VSVTDPREVEARQHATTTMRVAQLEDHLRRIRRIAHSLAQEERHQLFGYHALILEIETLADSALNP
jgi:hypothetical protein